MTITLRRWFAASLATWALIAMPFVLNAATDVTGTWVAREVNQFGEMEFVFRLNSNTNGQLSGSVTTPFGDAPILNGSVKGNTIELNIETESFGDLQRRTVKGKIVGDELQFESMALMQKYRTINRRERREKQRNAEANSRRCIDSHASLLSYCFSTSAVSVPRDFRWSRSLR